MFEKVTSSDFLRGEHEVLRFWREADSFKSCGPKMPANHGGVSSTGPITANNPMGVHHAWGRTLQGRLPSLLRHDAATPALSERLRLPGALGRSRSRTRAQDHDETGNRRLRHRQIRQCVQTPRAAICGTADRAVDPPGLLDGLGRSGHAAKTCRTVGTDQTVSDHDPVRENGDRSKSSTRGEARLCRMGRQLFHVLDREQ